MVATPQLQWVLDAITSGPAIVRNGRMDLLATNALGAAMHSAMADRSLAVAGGRAPNYARYTFLEEDSRRYYRDWDTAADTAVAILRTEPGATPRTRSFTSSSASCPLAVRSSAPGGATSPTSVDMVSETGLTLTIYAAELSSLTADAQLACGHARG